MSADSRDKSAADGGKGRATPGAHLRAELRRLGLDQVAVSKATGVSRQSVNNIINNRQPISRAMAGRLGRLTGHSSDYWLSEWFDETGAASSAKDAAPRAAGTGLQVNHQIERAIKDGIIVVAPFTPENLHATSIDLTLDATVTLPGGKEVSLAGTKDFMLAPGAAISASTQETIELPRDYYARPGAASALGRLGIVASTDFQLEPGFKGRLRFYLFNAGGAPFPLRAGEPVIALEIGRLAAMPHESSAS
jgi:deoxycytidine triphosphate deaminase/addiction module HigA family antidote